MFFKSAVGRKCDTTDLFLSSKAIDFVQETKYLGVMSIIIIIIIIYIINTKKKFTHTSITLHTDYIHDKFTIENVI